MRSRGVSDSPASSPRRFVVSALALLVAKPNLQLLKWAHNLRPYDSNSPNCRLYRGGFHYYIFGCTPM